MVYRRGDLHKMEGGSAFFCLALRNSGSREDGLMASRSQHSNLQESLTVSIAPKSLNMNFKFPVVFDTERAAGFDGWFSARYRHSRSVLLPMI